MDLKGAMRTDGAVTGQSSCSDTLGLNLMRRQDMGLQNSSSSEKPQQSKHSCGTVIDAQGREVEITEEMIRKACEALEKSRGQQPAKR